LHSDFSITKILPEHSDLEREQRKSTIPFVRNEFHPIGNSDHLESWFAKDITNERNTAKILEKINSNITIFGNPPFVKRKLTYYTKK
jgi:hypothetical protein